LITPALISSGEGTANIVILHPDGRPFYFSPFLGE